MTIDQSLYRDAMSRLGAAVNVITTDGPAGRHGLTASAVCSVTDTPPTLLVCVNRSARSHAGNRGLGVAARFAAASWRVLETGAPVLTDASVSLDCRIVRTETIGTHSVFFCEVVDVAMAPDPDALIYFNRTYHHLLAAT
jgi:flavin reductase